MFFFKTLVNYTADLSNFCHPSEKQVNVSWNILWDGSLWCIYYGQIVKEHALFDLKSKGKDSMWQHSAKTSKINTTEEQELSKIKQDIGTRTKGIIPAMNTFSLETRKCLAIRARRASQREWHKENNLISFKREIEKIWK